MGYGVQTGTHRIELVDFDGSDNWVDIRAARSYGAAQRQKAAGLRMKIGDKGKNSEVDFDFAASNLVMFKESIVAWSLKRSETDADPMPLTEETFREGLGETIGEWLAEEMQAYYSARTLSEEDRKNSNGRLTAP